MSITSVPSLALLRRRRASTTSTAGPSDPIGVVHRSNPQAIEGCFAYGAPTAQPPGRCGLRPPQGTGREGDHVPVGAVAEVQGGTHPH
jgi:hypothetical protein